MRRDIVTPLALGAGLGVLLAGVFALLLLLVDGCYQGDPGFGLCSPSDETCLARKDASRE